MTERRHVLHVRSSIASKMPTSDDLSYGEIAINYSDGNEQMFVKSSTNNIRSFHTDDYLFDKLLPKTGGSITGGLSADSGTFTTLSGKTISGKFSKSVTFTNNDSAFVGGIYDGSDNLTVNIPLEKKYVDGKSIKISANTNGEKTINLDLPASSGAGENSLQFNLLGVNIAAGKYSLAEGYSTKANGDYSHAEGDGTNASGDDSHAEGNSTNASGYASHAEGSGTKASGDDSHAEGCCTIASGDDSHAEGYSTIASGAASHAEGGSTIASGDDSHAEGGSTIARGESSHAEGYGTTASGDDSHAEGQGTKANGLSSHAEGYSTITKNPYEHASGQYNLSSSASATFGNSGNTLFSVGNGTDETARTNAFEIRQNGDIYTKQLVIPISNSPISSSTSSLCSNLNADLLDGYHYDKVKENILAEQTPITIDVNTPTPIVSTVGSKWELSGFTVSSDNNHKLVMQWKEEPNFSAGRYISFINPYSDIISPNAISFTLPIESGIPNGSLSFNNIKNALGGVYAFAEGDSTSAIGDASHAEGKSTSAVGVNSHAEGNSTSAYGEASHTEGYYNMAVGEYAHAEGGQTSAIGEQSHAECNHTIARGACSHAEGTRGMADGIYSHVEGNYTYAKGDSCHAEGNITKAYGYYAHSEGDSTSAFGKSSHAEGSGTTTSGESSHAEGRLTYANGQYSHAEGDSTSANGINSHSEGGSYTNTTYLLSENTIADGICSHAEGEGTSAVGEASHSEGLLTKATGAASHAEGGNTVSIGSKSHAEGHSTSAVGINSHAEGNLSVSNGNESHAEGYATASNGENSHTEGANTIAYNVSEHASGRFNISSSASTTFGDSGNTLFSVGNGTSATARTNAFEVRQNGDAYVKKNITSVAFLQSSDARSKENINSITDEEIEKSSKIELKSFNFKNDNRKHYGVIAQELQSIGLNELVNGSEETKYSVDYISLLILKIQELELRIKQLENK